MARRFPVTTPIEGGSAGGGSFWDNPTGKAVLEFDFSGGSPQGVASGIILAPTASVVSMYQWRWEAVERGGTYQLSARVMSGYVVFSAGAGTPDLRFGSGLFDPGVGSNNSEAQGDIVGYNYSRSTINRTHPDADGNTADRPVSIAASGEITFWYLASDPAPNGYAKGVLTVGPEVILPAGP